MAFGVQAAIWVDWVAHCAETVSAPALRVLALAMSPWAASRIPVIVGTAALMSERMPCSVEVSVRAVVSAVVAARAVHVSVGTPATRVIDRS